MKITLLTSNKKRHNYLINLFSNISDELFVIQECGTIFPGIVPGHYPVSTLMKNYFENVNNAQNKLFGNSYIDTKKNLKILPMISGDLNKVSLSQLSNFLKSDIYVVFGCSYIKSNLVDFLVDRYGEYILLKPKFDRKNVILWSIGPFVFGLSLLILLLVFSRRNG